MCNHQEEVAAVVVAEVVEFLLTDKLDNLQCCYRYTVLNTLNHLRKHLLQTLMFHSFLRQHLELKLCISKSKSLLELMHLCSNYHKVQTVMYLCKDCKH